ncbi:MULTISPECIES: lytic transglycosylase domain-containing protein [Nocardioides]|uniref:lytic transglycosylase domain-containing protein n=1 Tax=Nocardioides TaxID=1839 RepID=UPI00032E28C4|nr:MULTISPECIES: lytic murein transglycosylase [Nocardioides]EON25396.1 secreted protein [Nocardioides sp. CF8]
MPTFNRLQKATAVVPLAVLSVAWTASLTGIGASAALAGDVTTTLPDGSAVPTQAIEAPASVSSPTSVAPAAASGDTGDIIATASTSGIPSAALAAYQRAEAVINSADKACEVSWQLIAAIGRVESDHGRFGGNTLSEEGVAEPGIYGIALNGKNNTQNITDTDAGQYDSDTKFDRAVGPMQFIPSTWSVVGVDGDNDGKRNPQDIDDAALATAVYLCSGDDDLSTDKGQRASVYRYNHSNDYVDLVISIMQAYMDGDFTSVPNGTTSAGVFLPNTTGPTTSPVRSAKTKAAKGRDEAVVRGSTSTAAPTVKPTPTKPTTSTATPTPNPTPSPTKDPVKLPIPTKLPSLPTTSVTPLDQTLTVAQAQAQCLTSGISALDLAALNACVEDLMTP